MGISGWSNGHDNVEASKVSSRLLALGVQVLWLSAAGCGTHSAQSATSDPQSLVRLGDSFESVVGLVERNSTTFSTNTICSKTTGCGGSGTAYAVFNLSKPTTLNLLEGFCLIGSALKQDAETSVSFRFDADRRLHTVTIIPPERAMNAKIDLSAVLRDYRRAFGKPFDTYKSSPDADREGWGGSWKTGAATAVSLFWTSTELRYIVCDTKINKRNK